MSYRGFLAGFTQIYCSDRTVGLYASRCCDNWGYVSISKPPLPQPAPILVSSDATSLQLQNTPNNCTLVHVSLPHSNCFKSCQGRVSWHIPLYRFFRDRVLHLFLPSAQQYRPAKIRPSLVSQQKRWPGFSALNWWCAESVSYRDAEKLVCHSNEGLKVSGITAQHRSIRTNTRPIPRCPVSEVTCSVT
jgi:hypothetical protein